MFNIEKWTQLIIPKDYRIDRLVGTSRGTGSPIESKRSGRKRRVDV